ncbi:DUF547 domain-containing protein [Vibrio japonicus]|uniref:DUF547 domain-containing protein n=1 Tax=Vibrio japonicus TaxID=1824638 RepID=A0ABY5LG12_9VIBR|nr:DUF547 domain-containing protein [Vibrio japonicus]UUM30977.1 DUF547 domain-containing protein [Vibrio japonicus]
MKALLLLTLSLFSVSTFAAPKSELWQYWNSSNENSAIKVNHQKWQTILDKYLITERGNTLFRYKSVSSSDKKSLKSYIRDQSSIDPRQLTKAQQYAYWVNLYNAVTVDLILDAYPIKSITKLGGLFSFGPWDEEMVKINDKKITLNDIEHRILRPIWKDPRTHYAVNCASLGCPNLQTQAFTAINTEQLLENAASTFINSEKGVKVTDKQVRLSSIYEWFAEDFGTKSQLIAHLAKYRPELVNWNGRVVYDYDWSLNEKDS